MSKARIMGAGSSGYNYGVNKNSPGNGNGKWQGLWPSVGHARNARHINIEAGGNNRNVVFCMNQLGGVGKISNMFATTADGVKNCTPTCILSNDVSQAIIMLNEYARSKKKYLCMKGVNETIFADIGHSSSSFTPLDPNDQSLGSIKEYILTINNLNIVLPVKGVNQLHVVALVDDNDVSKLFNAGFGISILCNKVIAFGDGGGTLSSDLRDRESVIPAFGRYSGLINPPS